MSYDNDQPGSSEDLRPSWPASADEYEVLLVDRPAPLVNRITLNRPDKRNALNNKLRAELLHALREGDRDPDVHVQIIRGAGPSFSAGYDLGGGNEGLEYPFFTAEGEGQWPRHVTEGWMSIWDLAKPVIAQVHGFCLAGGSELATGCDVVYMAEDAQMGYPAVRFGVPDMQFHPWLVGMRRGMEMMLTGDSINGIEAVERGWATRAFPADELEAKTIEMAERMASLAPGHRPAEQARRPSPDGRDGVPPGHSSGHRALHPGDPPAELPGVHQPDGQGRGQADERAPEARREVR